MWIKLGIAAAVLTYAGISLASVNYRHLYNEMYPANGLKRDVLGLCQAAKPTFVRAVEQDRVDCYDGMPNSIEQAIGWVRTSARLAAMRTPTGVELAEKLMRQAELRQPFGVLQFASAPAEIGVGSTSCEQPTTTAANAAPQELALAGGIGRDDAKLAQRIANGDKKLLAELGLAKTGGRPGAKQTAEDLPILPLGGDGAAPRPAAGAPMPAVTGGCRTPA